MRRELLLAALVLASACRKPAEPEAAAEPRLVECAPITAREVRDVIEVHGTVAALPDRDLSLAPQVPGRLLAVDVREGDSVKKGQVVVRVDPAPLEDAVKQAEAAQSRANAEATNAATSQQRIAHVVDRGIAPKQEGDDAVARLASAKAAAVEADANNRQARRQLERTTVRSPFDGVVVKVLRKPGELVDGTPATPVVEVADLSQLELSADVPAGDLVRIARGTKATLTFPGLPGARLTGEVSMVGAAVDRTSGLGAVRVRLDSDPDGGTLRPPLGLFGGARLASGANRLAQTVPSVAVRSITGAEGEVVVCGADEKLHVVAVRVGAADEGFTEIEGTLDAGSEVAIDPVLGLQDGEALKR